MTACCLKPEFLFLIDCTKIVPSTLLPRKRHSFLFWCHKSGKVPDWPSSFITGNVCERLDRWTDTQHKQTLWEKNTTNSCISTNSPPWMVLIMVHDTLEHDRNDLTECPLKVLSRIYMDLMWKLIHINLHEEQTSWRADRGKLEKYRLDVINIPARLQKVSMSPFTSECQSVW